MLSIIRWNSFLSVDLGYSFFHHGDFHRNQELFTWTHKKCVNQEAESTASSYQKQAHEESIKIILSYVKIFHDSYPLNVAWTFSFESCFRPPFKIPPSPLLNPPSARFYLSTETFFSLITIIIDDVIITLIAQPFRSLFSKKKVPRGGSEETSLYVLTMLRVMCLSALPGIVFVQEFNWRSSLSKCSCACVWESGNDLRGIFPFQVPCYYCFQIFSKCLTIQVDRNGEIALLNMICFED